MIWDEPRFIGIDLAHCAAMINADGTLEQVCLATDWLTWGTYGDDYYPVAFGATRDLARAKALNERLKLVMREPAPEPVEPMERGLADLWRRTAGNLPERARAGFRAAVEDMIDSWVWELENQIANRIPDPIDYIEMRRKTFGSDMTASLARLAAAEVVPEEIYQTRVMRELETAAQDYACFTNDLFSYQKEIEFEGELHNMVLVVENFLDVDRVTARAVVLDLMNERMRQFEHILAHGLPALLARVGDPGVSRVLERHAAMLKDWMAGIMEWHRRCVRYQEPELLRLRAESLAPPPRLSLLPSGLGTSAVRLRAAR